MLLHILCEKQCLYHTFYNTYVYHMALQIIHDYLPVGHNDLSIL